MGETLESTLYDLLKTCGFEIFWDALKNVIILFYLDEKIQEETDVRKR